MNPFTNPRARLLATGFVALASAMGIGRFVYTPLLPLMRAEYGLTPDAAGWIATSNFAGYLAGSVLSIFTSGPRIRLVSLWTGLALSAATTLAMGFTEAAVAWHLIRFVSGIASALILIAAIGIISDVLKAEGAEDRLGWVFGGVGCGIALTGLIVKLGTPALGSSALWITCGALSLAVAPLVAIVLSRARPQSIAAGSTAPTARPLSFPLLLVAYTGEGLGYSVFATFISAIVEARSGAGLGADVWIAVGLASLPSCLLWAALARRRGFAATLALVLGLQVVGILLPALSASAIPALLGALLFGGTFIAITFLIQPLGKAAGGAKGFAVLTVGFGLGQMAGPGIAGHLIADGWRPIDVLSGSSLVIVVALAALLAAMALRNRPKTA